MAGALEGIKVVDLSRHAPGPYCSMILGDLGADVLKVEQPAPRQTASTGDTRPSGIIVREFPASDSPFDPLNRNKRSIAINLKRRRGQDIFRRLAADADVVLEGFRPGVTQRLGIDYDRLREINPRIIYCAITGYGQDGPYRNIVGHDINYISQGGLMGLIGAETPPGNFLGDLAGGGMQAAMGIMAAIIAREKTGRGQMVDISMTDGVVALCALYMAKFFEEGRQAAPEDRVSLGAAPFYAVYPAKDGRRLSFACSEPPFFVNLCKALGCEAFIPYHYDPQKAPEIRAHFARVLLTRTRDEWFNILSQEDIAVAKVLEPDEVAEDPQLRHRRMIVELDHPDQGKVKQIGVGIKLSDTPGAIHSFSPIVGQHSAAVLEGLGYDADQIRALHDEGVIYDQTING